VLLVYVGLKFMKERVTFRRTGYVAYQRRAGRIPLVFALSAILGAVSVLVWARSPRPLIWPFALGGLIGLVYLYRFARTRTSRYVVLAAVSVAIGVALQFQTLSLHAGTMWFFVLLGAAQLLAGALTLCLYLRRTSPPAVQAE
jgi:apolipoprotein N-acyltransferase